MDTKSLEPGDIVQVDRKGRRFHASFRGRMGIGAALTEGFAGDLMIVPLDNRISYRAAHAREIVGIWHANKRTRELAGGDVALAAIDDRPPR